MSVNTKQGPELLTKRVPVTPTVDNVLLKAHEDLANLDSDFQSILKTIHSSNSSTTVELCNLKEPIDDLISIFKSLKLSKGLDDTIKILQNLLSKCDFTLEILGKTSQISTRIERIEVLSGEKIQEWSQRNSNVVNTVRKELVRQHEESDCKDKQIEMLKKRLAVVEGERNANGKMVVNLVRKLNSAEEDAQIYGKEVKSLQSKLMEMKSQMAAISKWKDDVEGMGVAKALRIRGLGNASARDRALEYSRRVEARIKTAARPVSRAQTASATATARAAAVSPKRDSSRFDMAKNTYNPPMERAVDVQMTNAILGSLLDALTPHPTTPKSYSRPAESALRAKLSDIDSQLDLFLDYFPQAK
jgi:chromosome segregation ATPase